MSNSLEKSSALSLHGDWRSACHRPEFSCTGFVKRLRSQEGSVALCTEAYGCARGILRPDPWRSKPLACVALPSSPLNVRLREVASVGVASNLLCFVEREVEGLVPNGQRFSSSTSYQLHRFKSRRRKLRNAS
jgi:hypothetical protein